jgi:hypothetical protein
MTMLILNFSHPLTPAQREQLAARLGVAPEVRTIAVQIDHESPLVAQITAIVDQAGLTAEEWQTLPLVVNPPGFAPAALVLLAELHGRMGHFPTVLRLRPLARSTPTAYEVAELLNLQAVREQARHRR